MSLESVIKSMPITGNAAKASGTKKGDPARPFVHWVGGKREMISRYPELVPSFTGTYFEPFLGGGAMLFHLTPTKAVLNDSNEELIRAYKGIQTDVAKVIKLLKMLKKRHSPELYLLVRGLDRDEQFSKWSNPEVAARLIYLNQTGFNGVYRVNRKAQFNVPLGSSLNRVICDEIGLRSAAAFMSQYSFLSEDFVTALAAVKADDFVFLDPPYAPASEHSDFTRYTKDQFTLEDQKRVHEMFSLAHERGAKVLLTNANVPFITNLYAGFHQTVIRSSRNLNSKATRRNDVEELAITNYPVVLK
jgi:DNA adenine methylase